MLRDRYDNPLTTRSDAAHSSYTDGLDRFLAADSGVSEAFEAAVEADEGFSLGHLALSRFRQVRGDREGALEALAIAQETSGGLTPQELSLIDAFTPLIEGRPVEALQAIRRHLGEYPRDATALQTTTTVFGLIGFSGLPGREAEQLALTTALAPHYGDDWWFLSQHAFSQIEVGQIKNASANIERSYSLNPRSAQMAHVRSHVFYESGEPESGYEFLVDWLARYDRSGLLHGHISWHLALWALDKGEYDLMWRLIDDDISPDGSVGPPLVILCDTAAILYRAGLQGVSVPPDRWQLISEYAARYFPETGNAFGDVHAAVAHAMAGNAELLSKIIANAKGPARDIVSALAASFEAISAGHWTQALRQLIEGMTDHARIGGSKAQRDLLEFTLSNVLLKLGKNDEARRLLSLRRPVVAHTVIGI